MGNNFVADELAKLKQLLDSGAISQVEYNSQKEKLLNDNKPEQHLDKPKKKKHGCLISVILFFVITSVLFTISLPTVESPGVSTNSDESQNSGQEAKPNLELVDSSTSGDGYVNYITGHIKNNTNKTFSYVQVSINLYNGDTQVGSTLDNVTNLEAGAVWEFKAVVMEKNATSYKVAEITGY